MARLLGIAFFAVMVSALIGCSPTASSQPAQAHKEISIDEFRARVRANPQAKIVDVRSEAEYKEGHIEGAIVIPLEQIKDKAESLLNRDDEIILYCHDGPMGTSAAKILTDMGYKNVANVEGGINQWRRLGYIIVQ